MKTIKQPLRETLRKGCWQCLFNWNEAIRDSYMRC
ncbi:hypothetical protein [Enterococcus phage PEF7b]